MLMYGQIISTDLKIYSVLSSFILITPNDKCDLDTENAGVWLSGDLISSKVIRFDHVCINFYSWILFESF